MNISIITHFMCFALLSVAMQRQAAAEDFTKAIHAYLQQCVEAKGINVGIVVGIVDEHGSSIVSYGKTGNGTDQEVNGDTLFEIGSTTKTFTGLLLQNMVERGEVKMEDPVAKYLPESVKMPTRNGKEITLLQLATHTSGLPPIPDNLAPKRADNPYADYSVEKLYAFLSGYQLTRDPDAMSEYSNLGMGLLGHVIALKAGTNYESFVVDRICRPLKMDSTRLTLTPELKSRLATGHNQFGEAVPTWDLQTLAGAGGLRSTANDMLKYVSANLGLTPSSLTPMMEKTHDLGLAWFVTPGMQGTKIVGHSGGTGGYTAFAGFDKARRRGVVILSNSRGVIHVDGLGNFLLESEWQSDRRPMETKISSEAYDSYVGQYQRSPDIASRMSMMRRFLRNAPKAATYISAGFCLAVLLVLLWRAGSSRKRWIILGCAVLVSGLLATLLAFVSSHTVDAPFQAGIGIRREGDRIFAQATGSWPVDEWGTIRSPLFPPITSELLPESETRLFERLSGKSMTFSRDARGKVTGLTAHYLGNASSFEKVSDQSPKAPEPLKPRVAIKLDTESLDACVGHYEFAPNAVISPPGMKLTIWREGDQLVAQAGGKDAVQGPFDIYPESETKFFLKISGAQLTFIKNDKGEVTAVIHHEPGLPDFEGKKLSNPAIKSRP